MSERMIYLLINGTIDTITMTFVSGFLGFVLGLPLGV
ncbi:DL-methionine transporter permease subunit, partial [Providencia rettgeri Dmel1]